MNADFGIVYPLWNHVDGGDSLLERVSGEVGIGHVTIPVVTGPRAFFRFFGPHETPYFRTEGGLHFSPAPRHYAASGVKPKTARWCRNQDALQRVCATARALGLKIILRIDMSASEALGNKAADLMPRNAWGDGYESAPPCVSQPGVRTFAEGAVADLMRFEPDGFEIINPALDTIFPELVMSLLESPFGPGLEICFCAACRQIAQAEVDAEQAARSVRAHNSRFASLFKPGTSTKDLAERFYHDQVLAEYVYSRVRSAEAWLESVAERHPTKSFFLGPVGLTPTSIGFAEVAGVRRIAVYSPSQDEDEDADDDDEPIPEVADADEETRPAPGPTDAIAMPLWWTWQVGADALVRAVMETLERGNTFFDFSEVEQTPPATIDWLRQAVRYARRD